MCGGRTSGPSTSPGAGDEAAVEAGKQELLAIALGHRLAEVRR
jgi:hypothetical protein